MPTDGQKNAKLYENWENDRIKYEDHNQFVMNVLPWFW